MKIFGFLLFLVVAVLVQTVIAFDESDKELERCQQCFYEPYKPVCSKGIGTYYNQCELKCAGVPLTHEGECSLADLMENDERLYYKKYGKNA